jgi:hypothetical protein
MMSASSQLIKKTPMLRKYYVRSTQAYDPKLQSSSHIIEKQHLNNKQGASNE